MRLQSRESPIYENFETLIWEFRDKKSHLDVAPMESYRVYYKGEGGGFPQVRVVVNFVNPRLLVARPSTKNVQTMH
jgi:hypothetical protein